MIARFVATVRAIWYNKKLLWRVFRSSPVSVLILAFFKNSQYIMFGNAKMIRRLEICKNCEFNDREFCVLCGCHIPAAVLHLAHKCPIEKW